MGITYEPSVAEQLGPSIDMFAKGLGKLLQPNHDFQVAMQKAVGSNPQLAQQLADLEYAAPGSLDRLGFGRLGQVLSSIPESEKAQFLRTSRGDILKGDKQALEGQNTQTGFDLDRLHDTITFLKDPKNAAVNSDEILKRLTGQTYGERAGTAARTRQETVDADVKEAEAPGKIASSKVARKAYDDALAANPQLQNTDFVALARDFIAGKKGSSSLVSAAFATPGAQEAMSRAMAVVHEETADAFRMTLAAQHGEGSTDSLLTREAFQRYTATRGAGTLDAWKTILKDPNKVIEIKKKDPKTLTQEERDILHADAAQDGLQDALRVQNIAKTNAAISSSAIAIERHVADKQRMGDSPDSGFISAQVANLNSTLVESGLGITAKFGPRPPVGESDPGHYKLSGRGEGLYYVDASGNRVDDADVFVSPKGKTGSAGLSARALEFYTAWQGDPDPKSKASAAERLKREEPKLYEELKNQLTIPRAKDEAPK